MHIKEGDSWYRTQTMLKESPSLKQGEWKPSSKLQVISEFYCELLFSSEFQIQSYPFF